MCVCACTCVRVRVGADMCVVCGRMWTRKKCIFFFGRQYFKRNANGITDVIALPPMNENSRMRSHYGRRKYGSFSFLQPNIILLTELYREWYRLLAQCLYPQCLVDKAQIIPPVLLRFKVKTQITFTWLHYRLWIDSMTDWSTTEITLTFS